jgi:hypothetical protein
MAENLIEYLAEHPPQGFQPVPHYHSDGDFVTYYFRNDRCYAERVDDLLTVFVSFESKELVGCKIKGIQQILRTAGNFGVSLDAGQVRLGMFFFVGASLAKSEVQRIRYEQIGQKAQNVTMNRAEFETAC